MKYTRYCRVCERGNLKLPEGYELIDELGHDASGICGDKAKWK